MGYFSIINTKYNELLITLIVLQPHWWRIKNNHQPVCSSMCFILQGSGSLMFSLSFNKLCLCRFHFFLMLWCSSSLVDWWEFSSIYCWTVVGGASLKEWLLWEELHWRSDCCGRSFTEGVIVVGGASLKEEQICQRFWVCFYTTLHISSIYVYLLSIVKYFNFYTNSYMHFCFVSFCF